MIGVIADDLTGAAEAAGAAFLLGLTAEVHTTTARRSDADVVVVDTDTRSVTPAAAAKAVGKAAASLVGADWLFKKIDSLLRGNVVDEVRVLLSAADCDDALVVPANPAAGRIVCAGRYLVDGKPLFETRFARDPEHPRSSSLISELLGEAIEALHVPDVASSRDLERAAASVGSRTLRAGSTPFFDAMLRQRCSLDEVLHQMDPDRPAKPCLYLCGSLAAWQSGRQEEAEQHGIPVYVLPRQASSLHTWQSARDGVVDAITEHDGSVMVAIGHDAGQIAAHEAVRGTGLKAGRKVGREAGRRTRACWPLRWRLGV